MSRVTCALKLDFNILPTPDHNEALTDDLPGSSYLIIDESKRSDRTY